MSTYMRAAVAMALAGAMGGLVYVPPSNAMTAQQVVSQPKRNAQRHNYRGAIANWHHHTSGPGWTAAQVRRMSRKRRNQAAHKRACRMKGR